MIQDYRYLSTFKQYGSTTRYTIDKKYLRAMWIMFFVVVPLVTPIAAFANKIFKKDLRIVWRYD